VITVEIRCPIHWTEEVPLDFERAYPFVRLSKEMFQVIIMKHIHKENKHKQKANKKIRNQ
jgi:hypothetical protein